MGKTKGSAVKMGIDIEVIKKAIEKYYDRINNPKEESDFLRELDFFVFNAMFQAASKCVVIGAAGLIDYDKIEENLDVALLAPIDKIVPIICEKFNAPNPYTGEIENFINWYEKACEKHKIRKHPNFVFRKFFASK